MRPWREGIKTTVVITLGVVVILVGILVWALVFFRNTL
jgi:heme/copper-type cytochrome/quinol oxidase subunit 2